MSDFSNSSMLELFRMEVESHSAALNDGLVAVANGPVEPKVLEALMRAAHSIKGAARIVGLEHAVTVAHAMEDCFVAAQKGQLKLTADHVDVLLRGTDFLTRAGRNEKPEESKQQAEDLVGALQALKSAASASTAAAVAVEAAKRAPAPKKKSVAELPPVKSPPEAKPAPDMPVMQRRASDAVEEGGARFVRVNATSLSRLMGLAGEAMVDAGWLGRYEKSLRRLQDQQAELAAAVERLQEHAMLHRSQLSIPVLVHEVQQKSLECNDLLAERMRSFEAFALRSDNLSHRLYREVIASRMRPFGDGVQGFPRLVHDLARTLHKKLRFDVLGKNTEVDRDILDKLEAPLNHLLRNAVDHGIEAPHERVAAGKSEQGHVVLEAQHKGGMLFVTISDDGRGVDLERVRRKIIEKKMLAPDVAAKLTDAEVFEFLFLPGFSTAEKVTEISGRGVGLDVVSAMVHEVGGQVRISSQFGANCTFHIQLPLTLSVLNALLVDIAGEPYAFPLARIERLVKIGRADIQLLEDSQYFKLDGESIGLIGAQQVLELEQQTGQGDELTVVIVGNRSERYGLVVDRVLGERDVVVRPLDRRLGKVPNISAAALTEDGAPLLIVDVEDLFHSISRLLKGGRLRKLHSGEAPKVESRKRVLIVDDSLTVREVERKLLENRGYMVEVATDGAEGWNAVHSGSFDLVISDVDMPRMNGIELVTRIRADARFKHLPIMIVSYKDREEDRLRGMEAGANYYLTKSSFHDESLLTAVVDLIGEAR